MPTGRDFYGRKTRRRFLFTSLQPLFNRKRLKQTIREVLLTKASHVRPFPRMYGQNLGKSFSANL